MIYLASYENAAKLAVAAKANGWTGDGSALDYAEASDHCTALRFSDKHTAVAWLRDEINAMRTTFGCGDVTEIEPTARPDRCKYCTCGGMRPVRRYVVDDGGVADEEALDYCYND